jgi:hypothetical protein
MAITHLNPHKTMSKTKEEIKKPMGALDFAVKVKSIIVTVYTHGTEEPAQEVGRLYNEQLKQVTPATAEKDTVFYRETFITGEISPTLTGLF